MKTFQSIKTFFTHKIKLDFPALVICFAISCFIYYAYRSQNLKSNTFSVELQIMNRNEQAFIQSSPPSTQRIQINVDGEGAESLRPEDFIAYIDLSYVSTRGVQEFPVLIDYVSDRVRNNISLQIQTSPSHVSMEVDEVVTDFIAVEANIPGSPAKGYELKSVNVNPAYVRVKGPRSKIEGRKSVKTEIVNIINAKTSLKADNLNIMENLIFSNMSNEKISVEVEIVPIKEKRTFDLIPVNIANLDSRLEISSQANNISLEIYGNQTDLDSFEIPKNFIVADCSKIHSEGKFNVPIIINLPSKLSIADNLIKNVPISFNRKVVQVENIVENENVENIEKIE